MKLPDQHAIEEEGTRAIISERNAADLRACGVLFLCDECSRPACPNTGEVQRLVYHTTANWDDKCRAEGTDPVDRALEQING